MFSNTTPDSSQELCNDLDVWAQNGPKVVVQTIENPVSCTAPIADYDVDNATITDDDKADQIYSHLFQNTSM